MASFLINGMVWKTEFVEPNSDLLIDRTNTLRIATTDPNTRTVYLSEEIPMDMRERVLIHELGHCVIFSYDLFDEIHQMVYPEYWIDVEEWVCNFIADYGYTIFSIAKGIMGDKAWDIVPRELERLVA